MSRRKALLALFGLVTALRNARIYALAAPYSVSCYDDGPRDAFAVGRVSAGVWTGKGHDPDYSGLMAGMPESLRIRK